MILGSLDGKEYDDTPEADSDIGAGDARRELGLPERKFLDEKLAPPVDHELLRKYEDKQLSSVVYEQVDDLIVGFRSWNDAYTEMLLQDLRDSETRGAEGEDQGPGAGDEQAGE